MHERKAIAVLVTSERPDIVISRNTLTESENGGASCETGTAFLFWVKNFYSIAVSKLLHCKLGAVGAAGVGYHTLLLERVQFSNSDANVVIT